jgi:adenylosuccinate synthase
VKAHAVIGAGFGDEGKGLFVDYLCSRLENPIVVRFSGGQQAAHTVTLKNGVLHIFSNFGSGTLRGVPTYWSKYCTFDPVGFINELEILKKLKVNPIIYIDEKCPITTPYEIKSNRKEDRLSKHGSCGVGVGQTWQREEEYYSLLVGDLLYPKVFEYKLKELTSHYYTSDFVLEVGINRFLESCKIISKLTEVRIVLTIPDTYINYIFEGSQGLLLDKNIGFFPHVTRSNTGTKNIIEMGYELHVYLITRAHQTRHGKGPMTNEELPNNIKDNIHETNNDSGFQGKFRKSLLDIDLLNYVISKDEYIRETNDKSLVITCLDVVENEYRFTVNNGNIISSSNQKEFIGQIQKYLLFDFNEIYISCSPISDDILKFNY